MVEAEDLLLVQRSNPAVEVVVMAVTEVNYLKMAHPIRAVVVEVAGEVLLEEMVDLAL
jgi:hypothetical protein